MAPVSPPFFTRALLSPEARFFILTTGGTANAAAMREILDGPFDWAALCRLASADRATAVVWRCLQRLGSPVPEPVAEYLNRAAVVSEFELLRGATRLGETIRALDAQGIGVILLKGAAVAHTAYDSITERPMADFDLLVDPARIGDAQQVALRLGWVRSPGAAPDFAYRTHHHAVPLVDARGAGMHLELHTGLFSPGHPFGLSPDFVRRHTGPAYVSGCNVGVPSRSVLILHACLHFAWSHGMRKCGWRTLRDIARLSDGQPAVWDDVARQAVEIRGTTCTYWTLRLARQVAGIPVPDRVLSGLEPPLPERMRAAIARHFALQLFASEVVCPSAVVERAIWRAAMCPRRSGHGGARPWDRAGDFAPEASRGSAVSSALPGLWRQLSLASQWNSYLRLVLRGSRGTAAPQRG